VAEEVDTDDGRMYDSYYETTPEVPTQGQVEGQGDGPICRNPSFITREQFVLAFVRESTYLIARIDARVSTGVV
jgi:hypothetical protein